MNHYLIILLLLLLGTGRSESLQQLHLDTQTGFSVTGFMTSQGDQLEFKNALPLFTVDINDHRFSTFDVSMTQTTNPWEFVLDGKLKGKIIWDENFELGWKARIILSNESSDTIKVANMVPFGQSDDHIYITASGPWSLARTKLFRPNLGPVGVILPDNAWELGYSAIETDNGLSVYALTRRTQIDGAVKRRWWTRLPPNTNVEYTIYVEIYQGEWQNGLRQMFQERYLYDLAEFDESLFNRPDLQWVKHDYIIGMQMAWDHEFFDKEREGYQIKDFFKEGQRLFGGYDGYGIWPTWPRLGVDERNQWDMYQDIPGGLPLLKHIAEFAQEQGTRFFIAFNPWDRSTRAEDPLKGMARLIDATGADGVVLDTRGSSSKELQAAADEVKPGVVMYSEGMAVPKDMPGIISGRVHDAIKMLPPLNLNKLIRPDFAIFRVGQLWDGHLHRDISLAFFNGYGMELNTFHPGRPEWREEVYLYLGKTTKILRENSSVFLSKLWKPLISTLQDSIWVNQWPDKEKTIYSIYSALPAGFKGPLFEVKPSEKSHYVDLWHHEELLPDTLDGSFYLPCDVNSFDRKWCNTRREGNVDCIAEFPMLLDISLEYDSLTFAASKGDRILIWKGVPSYQDQPLEYSTGAYRFSILELFDRYEGKFVIQLFDKNELLDERIEQIEQGTARLMSSVERTPAVSQLPTGMVRIPPGSVPVKLSANDQSATMRYPRKYQQSQIFEINNFFMDKYPVTNQEFGIFLDQTGYRPFDDTNFLAHWTDGKIPEGWENYPVVYVSLQDARFYASWVGKRLPTELEWQLAAQGTDGRDWPWGAEFDSSKCNVGNGFPQAVDAYPQGVSPFGVMDLVGNVWQLTNDVYDNGSYYYVILRGGSYYYPTSSWWYVKGGPQSLNKHQLMYLVDEGFDRNATVGFRCVKDIK